MMRYSSPLLGKNIIKLETIDSTNAYAIDLLRNKRSVGSFLIIAKEQTNGRGQGEKIWESCLGGGYFSVTFHSRHFSHLTLIPIMASLAIRSALESKYKIETQLKWVNDVLYGSKKLAGILVESKVLDGLASVVIGIGLNVNNPQNGHSNRISLFEILGHEVEIEEVIESIVAQLNFYYFLYAEDRFKEIVSEYDLYSCSVGQKVLLKDKGVLGTVIGINENGYLLVVTPNEVLTIFSSSAILWKS